MMKELQYHLLVKMYHVMGRGCGLINRVIAARDGEENPRLKVLEKNFFKQDFFLWLYLQNTHLHCFKWENGAICFDGKKFDHNYQWGQRLRERLQEGME